MNSQTSDDLINGSQSMDRPYARIVEQPAPGLFRFRYLREYDERSGSIGSIFGVNTSYERKTFPTIQVVNYHGSYEVVVSCVTKDGHRPHPHPHYVIENVTKEVYNKIKNKEITGFFHKVVNTPDMTCSFANLGILSVKKKDIKASLELRKKWKVDPYGTGFDFEKDTYDLSVVRLCFQVFLKNSAGKHRIPIQPVFSEPIYDKKTISDLTIMKFSHCSASVTGGTEIIILCDRIPKEGVQIVFYDDYGSGTGWESPAEFHHSDIHKQVAISFRIPPYHNVNLQQPITVYVELRSGNKKGKPRLFQYLPDEIRRKKQKIEGNPYLMHLFHGTIPNSGHTSQELQRPVGVPRISRHLVTGQRAQSKTSLVVDASCCAEAFPREPSLFTSECLGASAFPTVPECVPSSQHLAPPHSRLSYITTPSNNNSYSPRTPLTESGTSTNLQQMPPISESVPSPNMHQMIPNSRPSNTMRETMPTTRLPRKAASTMKTTYSSSMQRLIPNIESVPSPKMHQMKPNTVPSSTVQQIIPTNTESVSSSNMHQMMPKNVPSSTVRQIIPTNTESVPSPNMHQMMPNTLSSSTVRQIMPTSGLPMMSSTTMRTFFPGIQQSIPNTESMSIHNILSNSELAASPLMNKMMANTESINQENSLVEISDTIIKFDSLELDNIEDSNLDLPDIADPNMNLSDIVDPNLDLSDRADSDLDLNQNLAYLMEHFYQDQIARNSQQ